MSSQTRKQLEIWIKSKSLSGKILDVGGAQLSIRGRAHIEEGSEITVLDLESPHQGEKPDIVGDLNLKTYVQEYNLTNFDYAVCLEVSEYWWNPFRALKTIHDFLKTGGKLFISFHFLYPVHNPVDQDYLRYTRRGAVKLLEEVGFEIDEIVSRTADEVNFRNFAVSEGMRAAKGYEFPHEVGVLIEATKK